LVKRGKDGKTLIITCNTRRVVEGGERAMIELKKNDFRDLKIKEGKKGEKRIVKV
jgi:hypothetical protein